MPTGQSSIYITSINTTGVTIDVNTLNSTDNNYTYALYSFIVLGNGNDMVNLTVNGVTMDLPAGFQFNFMPIQTIKVNRILCTPVSNTGGYVLYTTGNTLSASKTPGVCIMGEKTSKTMFGNF